MTDTVTLPAFTGSCQCGAVRYHFAGGQGFATICHCRMCQRAVGGPFAALLRIDEGLLTWESSPGVFASSDIADRGFCPTCGTPLFYRQPGSGKIEVTSGSLPPHIPFTPVRQWGMEARADWLAHLDLPGAETSERVQHSHQSPE